MGRSPERFHTGGFFMQNAYHKELESSILEKRHYDLISD